MEVEIYKCAGYTSMTICVECKYMYMSRYYLLCGRPAEELYGDFFVLFVVLQKQSGSS